MLAVEDAEARSPLGNLPVDLAAMSEQEQIAWAEQAAEELREEAFQSEAREVNWSEEEKN
jgi:hypothetical protein